MDFEFARYLVGWLKTQAVMQLYDLSPVDIVQIYVEFLERKYENE